MSAVIRTNSQAHAVVDHINTRMSVGQTFEVGGDVITKIDDRDFTVNGSRFLACELADCLIWPKRKVWNVAIKEVNKGI